MKNKSNDALADFSPVHPTGTAEYHGDESAKEPEIVNCRQCGWGPIDTRARERCPFCDSDKYLPDS